jgi:HlyD family secretion protein
MARFGSENLQMKQTLYEKEEIDLLKTIKTNEERIEFIADKIKAQDELLEKGLITKETLYNTKNQFFNVQQENENLANDLKRIHNNMFQIKEENEIELQKLKSEILEIENSIRELNALFELNSTIYSPFEGKIIEVMVNPGKVVNAGIPIISIEPIEISKKLEAIVYVNPRDGKKIKSGMKAKIFPSTIEVEEYGYIIGEITKVAEYPATHQGMLRTLGNDELVKSFLSIEPPIAITVSPEIDSTTFSGFKWSSIKGPAQEIRSGTLCTSKIIVENKRPISLLIPQKAKKPFILFKKQIKKLLTTTQSKNQIIK